MKVRWKPENISAQDIEAMTGKSVRSLTEGQILISVSPEGVPTYEPGVEIDFEEAPTPGDLVRLDSLLSRRGLIREG